MLLLHNLVVSTAGLMCNFLYRNDSTIKTTQEIWKAYDKDTSPLLFTKQKWVNLEDVKKLLMDWEIKCLSYPRDTPRDMYFEWCRKELLNNGEEK